MYCSWLRLTHGGWRVNMGWEGQNWNDSLKMRRTLWHKNVLSNRNAPKTDKNIKMSVEKTTSTVVHNQKTCSYSYSRDPKNAILVKFLLRFSFHAKLATESPGVLLHPTTFMEEEEGERKKKKNTDRKFPPEPYNHCNNVLFHNNRPKNKSA